MSSYNPYQPNQPSMNPNFQPITLPPTQGFVNPAPPPPLAPAPTQSPPPVYDPSWAQPKQTTFYPPQNQTSIQPSMYPQQPQQSQPAPAPQSVYVHVNGPPPPVISPAPQRVVRQVYLQTELGASSANLVCPYCQATVWTTVKEEAGVGAWLSCSFMFVFMCWCCCVLPFFMDSFKKHYHLCPNCNRHLGKHSGSMSC